MPDFPPVSAICRTFADNLRLAAPTLSIQVDALTHGWLSTLLARLDKGGDRATAGPKIFNDPVWGSILLQPAETLLLDTPMIQRLRGVRQLGMAYLVYPGAGYGRLEHICGVVEGTQRIVAALDASASTPALRPPVPSRRSTDLEALRLAALLHDVGHGPFSHATESLIEATFKDEFEAAKTVIFDEFSDVLKVSPAEILSIFIVLSRSLLQVFTHPQFPVSERENLPMIITSAILGSSKHMSAPYLGAIVSGPIDADKLDYMVRDSHHAGLNIGLETTRLLSQLQIAVLTEQNAPDGELRNRARDQGTIYELGISRAGIGAYEQMIVGRAILYDRVYYHHKVRVAEAMVRRLIRLAEQDNLKPFTLSQLVPTLSDDTFIHCLGGQVAKEGYPAVSAKTQAMAEAIINRNLFKRAFAFATRFLEGIDLNNEQATADSVSLIGRDFYKLAGNQSMANELEAVIAKCATQLTKVLGGSYSEGRVVAPEDVIVDLPSPDKIAVSGQDILVRTGGGDIELPNLYFDPQKWSRAYQVKKLCGFVFCAAEFVPVVNLASKIVFAERYQAVMNEGADRLAKTTKLHNTNAFQKLLDAGLISVDLADRLRTKQRHFVTFVGEDLDLPIPWLDDGDAKETLVRKLRLARPRGYTQQELKRISDLIKVLARFHEVVSAGGTLKQVRIGEEMKLQAALLAHIRSSGHSADEGPKLGGGISDVIFNRNLVIENKILAAPTDSPFVEVPDSAWQARRYSIPLSKEILATVVGYKPKSELGHLLGRDSIDVRKLSDGKTIEIRLVVPVDYTSPSLALAPRVTTSKPKRAS